MGALCASCFGRNENLSEQERARMTEAQAKAGLAAQQRAEAFDKSATGRAARVVAAAAAKPAPPPSRGEPTLKWQMG